MAILVPYDGSDPAQAAVQEAISVYDDEIVLLRVLELSSGSIAAGFDLVQERLKEERDEQAEELSAEMTELIDDADVEFTIETVVGQPARAIVDYVEDHPEIDRIVIGSHGREGVSRVLLGNVAEKVVRRSPVTVTVVREEQRR
jgi:nucleotide-binding universal stress UspA family protein